MENYKTKLNEYAQGLHLPLPLYESENEGASHLPSFKSYVTVDGQRYESSASYTHKREAEQSAAQAAVQHLCNNETAKPKLDEILGKKVLSELLVKLGWPFPTFSFTKEGASHCPIFTSTVEINGVTYVGVQGKTKKDAETKAAFVAFQTINARIGGLPSQLQLPAESRETCDLKQPIENCEDVKSEVETITNSYTPNNQFLVGTTSCQSERALENLRAENIHAVGMGYRNSSVNNVNLACATLMHNHHERESSLIQKCELNKESEDVIQQQEYGPEETEEKKEVVQEDRLTESIEKRNRSELKTDSKKKEGTVKRQRFSTRILRSPGN